LTTTRKSCGRSPRSRACLAIVLSRPARSEVSCPFRSWVSR
jgi:hypothetical protein